MIERQPGVDREPIGGLRSVGLGYVWEDAAGIRWGVTRLHDRWDGLHGELEVRRLNAQQPEAGHRLFRGRINLASSSDRESKARYLLSIVEKSDAGLDKGWWLRAVAGFAERVLDAYRVGAPFLQLFGSSSEEDEPVMMLDPIIWADSPAMIYGPGGSGKSTIAGAIAVSVETGIEIVPGWHPEITAPVLVLDWESHETIWRSQVRAICRGAGIEPPKLFYRPMTGSLADDIEAVAAFVSERAVGLVIIDSVEPASSGAEADDYNRRAERFFDAVRHLNAARCAALLLDHVTGADLNGTQPVLKSIGGVRKRDRSRAAWELRAEADPVDGRIEVVLRDGKHNLTVGRPPIGLAIHLGDLDAHGRARRITLAPTGVDAPELVAAALSQPDRILRELRAGSVPTKVIAQRTGISENAVRSNLTRLVRRGRVCGLPDGSFGLIHR